MCVALFAHLVATAVQLVGQADFVAILILREDSCIAHHYHLQGADYHRLSNGPPTSCEASCLNQSGHPCTCWDHHCHCYCHHCQWVEMVQLPASALKEQSSNEEG